MCLFLFYNQVFNVLSEVLAKQFRQSSKQVKLYNFFIEYAILQAEEKPTLQLLQKDGFHFSSLTTDCKKEKAPKKLQLATK